MNEDNLATVYCARTDLLIHRADEIWVLVDPGDDHAHTLNASAMWLWHQCDGVESVAQLARRLAEMAGIPLAQANADAADTLRTLATLGLMERE